MHQLYNDLENRAIVLGAGSEPETYLIWATHPTLRDEMAYKQNVVLKQVKPEEIEPTASLCSREQPKRRWTSNSIDLRSESPKRPRTDHHQQRPLATPRPQQPFARAQQPVQHDLQQAYRVNRGHVIHQKDHDTGLSIMFSNQKLRDYVKSVEASAEMNDEYLFRTMREMVDEELVGAGFPRLPML